MQRGQRGQHAELGNAPLFPWPHRETIAAHCSAEELRAQYGFLFLHIWQELAEEGAAWNCPGFTGLARESSLSSYRERSTK